MSIKSHLLPLKLTKKIEETPSAYSLVFEDPEASGKFNYFQPGQYISLCTDINEEEVVRSYSFSSSPLEQDKLKVTIQRIPEGRMSNHLGDHLNEGDTIGATPPAGHFFKMEKVQRSETQGLILVGAGSGVTPLFSIIKFLLEVQPDLPILLVDCNRDSENIIFKQELTTLDNKYSRFSLVHHLSREGENPQRLEADKLMALQKEFLEKNELSPTQVDCYLCGPQSFYGNGHFRSIGPWP